MNYSFGDSLCFKSQMLQNQNLFWEDTLKAFMCDFMWWVPGQTPALNILYKITFRLYGWEVCKTSFGVWNWIIFLAILLCICKYKISNIWNLKSTASPGILSMYVHLSSYILVLVFTGKYSMLFIYVHMHDGNKASWYQSSTEICLKKSLGWIIFSWI